MNFKEFLSSTVDYPIDYSAATDMGKEVYKDQKSKLVSKIKYYDEMLTKRYNKTVARIIIANALLGLLNPMPGSFLLHGAMATLVAEIGFQSYRFIKSFLNILKSNPVLSAEIKETHKKTIEKIQRDFQNEL